VRERSVTLHGRELVYRSVGEGPCVLLIHGITQDSRTWASFAPRLEGYRVLAPDLPGHGRSANPPGDHSMGSYASALRDLLLALEIPSATVVGHSLGGGIALQFAYQFPAYLDRLVLIDSGGLGPDVSPLLRAATLPGADLVIRGMAHRSVTAAATAVGRTLSRVGLRAGTDLQEAQRGIAGMADPDVRRGFLGTVRTNIGPRGQRVSATDRLYLARHVPSLILWGERDRIIPPTHGRAAHRAIEGSRFELVPGAGHFPHLDAPESVAEALLGFLAATEPAELTREQLGDLITEAVGDRVDRGSGAGVERGSGERVEQRVHEHGAPDAD
jgi:pimeloyl-ACP methyl ester carboxylesterase